MDSNSLPQGHSRTKEHHGLDYLLVAFALGVEALALIFGFYLLALGAAVMLWFALREYTKRLRSGKSLKWNRSFGTIAAVLLLLIVAGPVGLLKRHMEKHSPPATPANSAQTTPPPFTQIQAQTQTLPQRTAPSLTGPAGQTKPQKRSPKAAPATAPKPSDSAIPAISQSNSGGINVQQATTGENSPIIDSPVTIVGKPEPTFTWTQQLATDIPGKVVLTLTVADTMERPAFIALCDRPCKSARAIVPNSVSVPLYAQPASEVVAIGVMSPPSITPTLPLYWSIKSLDGTPLTIKQVERFPPDRLQKAPGHYNEEN
jgi:hypothetical protein